MVKKEEYTGKSDPDYYFKYAMRNGIQCVSRIYSACSYDSIACALQ